MNPRSRQRKVVKVIPKTTPNRPVVTSRPSGINSLSTESLSVSAQFWTGPQTNAKVNAFKKVGELRAYKDGSMPHSWKGN